MTHFRLILLPCLFLLAPCGGEEEQGLPPLEDSNYIDLSFNAPGYFEVSFRSEECIAILTETEERGEELIIHGSSDDNTLSLSIILNMRRGGVPGIVDLSDQKVIFAESDVSGDVFMIADEVWSGSIEVQGRVSPSEEIFGDFSATLSVNELIGEGERKYDSYKGTLEGSYNLNIISSFEGYIE